MRSTTSCRRRAGASRPTASPSSPIPEGVAPTPARQALFRWPGASSALRAVLAVLLFALPARSLAGCAGGGGGGSSDPAPDVDFEDLDLKATATTGRIRGVVVDSAIRPVGDAV